MQLLSTIVKYPVPSTGIDLDSGDIKTRKMGYYLADEKMFREIERETGTNGLSASVDVYIRGGR